MKLSEAIREGTSQLGLTPLPVQFDKSDGSIRATALAAAWFAATGGTSPALTRDLYELFPALSEARGPECPAGYDGCSTGRNLEAHIIHLEDKHDWDPNGIADWLTEQGL